MKNLITVLLLVISVSAFSQREKSYVIDKSYTSVEYNPATKDLVFNLPLYETPEGANPHQDSILFLNAEFAGVFHDDDPDYPSYGKVYFINEDTENEISVVVNYDSIDGIQFVHVSYPDISIMYEVIE